MSEGNESSSEATIAPEHGIKMLNKLRPLSSPDRIDLAARKIMSGSCLELTATREDGKSVSVIVPSSASIDTICDLLEECCDIALYYNSATSVHATSLGPHGASFKLVG